ncbi:ATP-binding protein [uncultured Pseudodesulfovibrio sp.]|uniref:ATP-binding protein n=1 Tax=uncultured Pseudodesulfovibrio sp. TaxID=2035858 RepID=UPI0029C69106|nr:ATP-binding protein [uncultured Pseudodesulfovibrio sp.]
MTPSIGHSVTLFLAQISLPVRRIMAQSAVEFAAQIAKILSFDAKGTFGIKLAVDEAFCNAVDHFSGPAKEDERIHIEFFIEEDFLVISIREKGIPFDLQQAERYTPDCLENMNKPGLGTLLMHQSMDSVELFVHGREGKETRLKKRLAYGTLPQELLDTKTVTHGKKRITVKEPDVRLTTVKELPEVCRLAWRCYGYTQEDFLYDLDALTKKVEHNEFLSVAAFDPDSGAMIGHAGFKYHDPAVKVPELGLAFVDPTYRSPDMPKQMARLLFDLAEAEGDLGIFDCSVTTHTFSQKGMHAMGSRPCSLFLGIAASGMQAKELGTSKQEKGSVINHYFAFDRSPKTIYVPRRHTAMVSEIYEWLEVPRKIEHGDTQPPTGESSVSVFPLPDELNVAFIIVHAIGENTRQDVAEGLLRCKQDRRDAVYAFLPLGVSSSPRLVEECEKMGFSFAGIMPHIHDGDDRILMQYIDVRLDLDAIRVYGDMSRKLFAYIKEEQLRVKDL